MHDLLLEYVRMKIKAENDLATTPTELQAEYLSRLDVVEDFQDPEHGAGEQGLYFLMALWRSVEELSGNPKLQADSYRATLGELESCGTSTNVGSWYSRVGDIFLRQVRYAWDCPSMLALQHLVYAPYLSCIHGIAWSWTARASFW